jgi:Flp pilus assembly pilin Flp
MNQALLKLHLICQDLFDGEEGQDLVEYALLLTMISLALISCLKGITDSLISVFSNVSSSL